MYMYLDVCRLCDDYTPKIVEYAQGSDFLDNLYFLKLEIYSFLIERDYGDVLLLQHGCDTEYLSFLCYNRLKFFNCKDRYIKSRKVTTDHDTKFLKFLLRECCSIGRNYNLV